MMPSAYRANQTLPLLPDAMAAPAGRSDEPGTPGSLQEVPVAPYSDEEDDNGGVFAKLLLPNPGGSLRMMQPSTLALHGERIDPKPEGALAIDFGRPTEYKWATGSLNFPVSRLELALSGYSPTTRCRVESISRPSPRARRPPT